MKQTIQKALNSAWIIIKLVIPIYIFADILYYYNTLSHISFLVKPITSILGLPQDASLSIVSGVFLNLYAAIAFAAPLLLSAKQWTILALFLGVCHSLVVENSIMKKLGISKTYSYLLRFFGGMVVAYSASFIPKEMFSSQILTTNFTQKHYNNIGELLLNSSINAVILSIKIVVLITLLIFVMEFIKNLSFIKNNKKNVSVGFSILIGMVLGITYGAGILINESKSMKKETIFFVATFLMICHAIIEDTLLFVMFGADFWMVVIIRTLWAFVLAFMFAWGYGNLTKRDKFKLN